MVGLLGVGSRISLKSAIEPVDGALVLPFSFAGRLRTYSESTISLTIEPL
jgi:hypothetical protein